MKHLRIALAISISLGFLSGAASPAAKGKVNWEKEVWPFIERSCVDCHKAPYEEAGKIKEPKAELRFDGAWAILKGGENGPVLKPGNAKESDMYFRVTLPEDDSDFMPSKGEPLTEKEKEILKQWITEGADFGGWEGNLVGKPEDEEPKEDEKRVAKPLPPSVYEILSKGVAAPSEEAIKAVVDSGARVEPLSDKVTFYRVDYFNSRNDTDDSDLAALAKLKPNVAQLNVGETGITDAGVKHIGGLPNLIRLDLHQTKIGDAAVDQLVGLKHLEYLNLYDTQVTDNGLQKLGALKNLKAVYLWKTKATDSGIKKLQKQLPDTLINWR